ncbi:uracil permease [Streptomyces sp. CB00316]|uniref:solute carrier family 23 protein n=1 Tax=Streptomyces sp. CB00316 TaxID=1703932 RepID=UPI000938EC88|nr:solute carrier family 23 protein [Streptomyces sp. CB00316]OKJ17557.1 uracil permease [Streptomyces sp. CB00316]
MAQPATGPVEGLCEAPRTLTATAVHPVDEKLPPARLVPAALQHIAAMYAGVVTPPLIIGQAVGLDTAGMTRLIAASLLIAGIATIVQTVGVGTFAGNRLPFVNAASSAGIAPMLAIAETSAPGHRLPAIYGAVLVAGVLCLAVGPFFGRLLRFFPPLVTGVVITLIGVTLMPVPVAWAQGGDATAADFGAMKHLALAAFTLVVILLIQRFGRGFLKKRRADGRTTARGLRTDGIATSAFAQNVGVVSLVPMPVLGGAGVVLFGSIAVSGIRTLSEAGLDDSSNIILVAVALGAGVIPLAAPTFHTGFPAWAQTVLGSGISAGALVAVVFNLFFHHLGTHSRPAVALKSS